MTKAILKTRPFLSGKTQRLGQIRRSGMPFQLTRLSHNLQSEQRSRICELESETTW